MVSKKTKIVCTIGPASASKIVLKKMVRAGMNVARLNFSHGKYSEFDEIVRNIRAVSKELNIPVAIMQDLQGPKIRVGLMPKDGVTVKKGKTVILTVKKTSGNEKLIPVQYRHLPKDVSKGDKILISDGLIELKVLKKTTTDIYCTVIEGGKIESNKGINVPTASISANPLTAKDLKDLNFGLAHDVDYVALSFVRTAKDIANLREIIRRKRARAKIVAKIERHEAVKNLEEIIHETDGVMVARGDLGVEVPPETVPIIQKKIIHLANLHGKPVITATEMLQSMVTNPRATRAEVSDVANAVFDHTDAVMLSNESAVGKYPVKAVETLARVAQSTEHELEKHEQFLPSRLFEKNEPLSYATCSGAAELAKNMKAKLIVAITYSGFTAQHIAKHRIHVPIIVLTEDPKVEQQMQLVWGVQKTIVVNNLEKSLSAQSMRKLLLQKKLAQRGDSVVVVVNASRGEKLISTIVM
ncbi:MAG TPA: pyruvate kinase [Candidatus Gracilibacteria bacterium]|nr:pyruvate kinase [Candidatus Gracilibacteria bacterium]